MVLMHANDLLDLRIIENGTFVPNMTAGSICVAITEMVDLMNSTLENKSLTIVYKFSSGIPKVAWFDKRRLQQVLLNLLSNAVKYSHNGKIKVYTQAAKSIEGQNHLVVTVKDQGIGL